MVSHGKQWKYETEYTKMENENPSYKAQIVEPLFRFWVFFSKDSSIENVNAAVRFKQLIPFSG